MNMLYRGQTKISRNLSKQPFPTGSGKITLKNSLRDYPHLLKSPNFRLLVLTSAGSYSRVFTVCYLKTMEGEVSISTLLGTMRVYINSSFLEYFDGHQISTF